MVITHEVGLHLQDVYVKEPLPVLVTLGQRVARLTLQSICELGFGSTVDRSTKHYSLLGRQRLTVGIFRSDKCRSASRESLDLSVAKLETLAVCCDTEFVNQNDKSPVGVHYSTPGIPSFVAYTS